MIEESQLSRRSVLGAAGVAIAGGFAAPAAADHDGSPDAFPETCGGPGFNDTPVMPWSGWRFGDACRPQPPVVDPGEVTFPDPPADATVLLGDGENGGVTLDDWTNRDGDPSGWTVTDNYVEVNPDAGWLQSKDEIGDAQYHVEWRVPEGLEGSGQTPGNSGVWLASNYEVQILDSYENPTYPDGMAGALYGEHPPLVNAARPPGEWQKYDIVWHAPRFTDDGSLESPGVVTVYWNGILVQSETVVHGSTPYKAVPEYSPHPVEMPLQLQNHGQPVQYRNIWYQPLPTPASVLAFEDDQLTAESTTVELDAALTNAYDSVLTDGEVTLTPPDGSGVSIDPQGTSFETLPPGEVKSMSWQVSREGAEGDPYLLTSSTAYSVDGERREVQYQVPLYSQPTEPVGSYYQIDFVAGQPIEALSQDHLYAGEDRLLRFAFMEYGSGITDRGSAWASADVRECLAEYGHIGTDDGEALVRFTVAEGCELTLSLAVHTLPAPEFDIEMVDQQRLFDATTGTFGPGEHTITVPLPGGGDD